jgi:hypothetical protein
MRGTQSQSLLNPLRVVFTTCALALCLQQSAQAAPGSDTEPHWYRLGNIVGAVWEQSTGQLHIVGDGSPQAAGFSSQDVAIALEWGTGRADNPGYVSIDPNSQDPSAPFMNVVVNDGALNTSFGWTMFEADRVMKSMAVGADSLTRAMLKVPVRGFKNMIEIGDAHATAAQDVWSRFWFRPGAHRELVDEHALKIVSATVKIDTEVMVRRGNALVSSGGARDVKADEFATFFNTHYEQLAQEEPVLQRLQQLYRLLLIAEWVRGQRLPVDYAYLRNAAAAEYPMPVETPGIGVESTTVVGSTTRYARVFGGVSFAGLELAPTRTKLDEFAARTLAQAKEPSGTSQVNPRRDATVASFPHHPVHQTRFAKRLVTRLALANGRYLELWGRTPNAGELSTYEAGDTVLAQPVLLGVNPNPVEFARGVLGPSGSSRRTEKRGVQGHPAFPVRTYQMFDEEGRQLGVFSQHRLDQRRGEFVVESDAASTTMTLVPDGDALVWVEQSPDHLLHFEPMSGLLVAEQVGQQLIVYQRNRYGVIERILLVESDKKKQVVFEGVLGNNGRRLLALRPTGGADVLLVGGGKLNHSGAKAPRSLKVQLPYQRSGEWRTLSVDVAEGKLTGTADDARLADYLGLQAHRIAAALLEPRDTPTVLGFGARTLVIEGKAGQAFLLDTSVENPTRLLALYQRAIGNVPADIALDAEGYTAIVFGSHQASEVQLVAADGRHGVLSGEVAQNYIQRLRGPGRPVIGARRDIIEQGLPDDVKREEEQIYQHLAPRVWLQSPMMRRHGMNLIAQWRLASLKR